MINILISFMSIFLMACASNPSLSQPEGPVRYKMDSRIYESSYTTSLTGRTVFNQSGTTTVRLSFIKGSVLVETFIKKITDLQGGANSSLYKGSKLSIQTAYEIVKTSADEIIVKIVEYKARTQDYLGPRRSLDNWSSSSLSAWRDSDFKYSKLEMLSTYKIKLKEQGKKLTARLVVRDSSHYRIEELDLYLIK